MYLPDYNVNRLREMEKYVETNEIDQGVEKNENDKEDKADKKKKNDKENKADKKKKNEKVSKAMTNFLEKNPALYSQSFMRLPEKE